MDIKAEVLMRNMPADTNRDAVKGTLARCIAEWLDFDRHPDDLAITLATDHEPLAKAICTMGAGIRQRAGFPEGPIFVISDLHMGDGGPRDNFAYGDRESQLQSFLDFVEDNHGRLVVCGDLFELWQSNVSKVLTRRMWLLDRLAKMQATYVLGNHDADLRCFVGRQSDWLHHPFFERMCLACYANIGSKLFQFIHGHEADPYCSDDAPGLGRITAIYSGLAEDRNGGPMLDEYRTVEQKVVGRMERFVSFWNRLRGKPDRFTAINRTLRDTPPVADVVICGHTHRPGHIGMWHYNCGTWAERINSFVCVNPHGAVGVFNWIDDEAVPNQTELPI